MMDPKIQFDWCLYKKRHRMHMWSGTTMAKRHQGGSHLKPEKRPVTDPSLMALMVTTLLAP